MALEPRTVTAEEPENHELKDMTRRFWISTALSGPLMVLAMFEMETEAATLSHLAASSPWRLQSGQGSGLVVAESAPDQRPTVPV